MSNECPVAGAAQLMYGTYAFALTITFPVVHGTALIDSIEYISKTAYRAHT